MEPEEVYAKLDYEGGFWELIAHSGTDFLKGTPFEDKIALIEEAVEIGNAATDYFESISEDDDYEADDWDEADLDGDDGDE